MALCDFCGKEIEGYPHKCKYCGQLHCSPHILPESHDCEGLRQYQEKNNEGGKNAISSVSKNMNSQKIEAHSRKKSSNPVTKRLKKIKYWLTHKDYRGYDYQRRFNYLVSNLFYLAISLIALSIFYTNATKLNEIHFWVIKIGGILILTSLFFTIKLGWRLIREVPNIIKRQINLIKYLIIIIAIILLWQSYSHRDTVLNPVFEVYEKTDWSLFSPFDNGGKNTTGDTNQEISRESNQNKEGSFTESLSNFFYGLEEGETRVKSKGFLHFNKIPVYYELNDCFGERRSRVVQALNIIEKETGGILPFRERADGDIKVFCNSQLETEHASGYGGPTYYEGSTEIIEGSVELYDHDPSFSRCESYPVTEIHEILHALGINHINDKNSIMHPGDSNTLVLEWGESDQPYVCTKIDRDISNCLIYIYSSGGEGTPCTNIPFL